MILWIILTALVAVVAAVLAIAFVRRSDANARDGGQALAIARDQIAELERERAAGLIGDAEAAQARSEIERRIVAAVRAPEQVVAQSGSDKVRTIAVVGTIGWVTVGSALLYQSVGRPDLPSVPFTGVQNASVGQMPAQQAAAAPVQSAATGGDNTANVPGSVEELIVSLAARLKDNPQDAEGWRMLGWSYFNTEDYANAAEAYAKAVELDASDPDVLSAYGETLVRAEDGLVSDTALQAFEAALKINPDDPRARFFKGMSLEQAGDPGGAIKVWQDILNTAPAGAEWAAGLRQRIEELAAASNIEIGELPAAALLPPAETSGAAAGNTAAPGPTAQDVQAAQEMSPEDRQEMIRSMVDRLAARLEENPNDAEGWIRLMRSRMVLGDRDAALQTYKRAAEVFASDPAVGGQLQAAAEEFGLATQ